MRCGAEELRARCRRRSLRRPHATARSPERRRAVRGRAARGRAVLSRSQWALGGGTGAPRRRQWDSAAGRRAGPGWGRRGGADGSAAGAERSGPAAQVGSPLFLRFLLPLLPRAAEPVPLLGSCGRTGVLAPRPRSLAVTSLAGAHWAVADPRGQCGDHRVRGAPQVRSIETEPSGSGGPRPAGQCSRESARGPGPPNAPGRLQPRSARCAVLIPGEPTAAPCPPNNEIKRSRVCVPVPYLLSQPYAWSRGLCTGALYKGLGKASPGGGRGAAPAGRGSETSQHAVPLPGVKEGPVPSANPPAARRSVAARGRRGGGAVHLPRHRSHWVFGIGN